MSSCCATSSCAPPTSAAWGKLVIAALVAAQSMIFGLAVNLSPPTGEARIIIHSALALAAAVVFVLAGGPLVRAAWHGLRDRRVTFDQLFLLGIAGAFAASVHSSITGVGHVYYEVVAVLLAIHTFGNILIDRRRREALDAAADFGRMLAEADILLPDGRTEPRRVGDLTGSENIPVPVGGVIPVDGVVASGVAQVAETALTGEPFPVTKRVGDPVLAGSHAVDGAMVVRAVGPQGARRIDSVIAAVAEARTRPSRLQREADRLAGWFVPVILTASVSTFLFWTVEAGWEQAVFNALAVLLVACPCSMGLATPVAIWSALASLARRGLRVHNPDLVEHLALTDVVVFDKTGTLGEENLVATDFVTADGFDRARVRRFAAALEASSDHPMARAFRDAEPAERARNVRLLPGAGLAGELEGNLVAIGNITIVPHDQRAAAAELSNQLTGTHDVFVMVNDRLAAAASVREVLREGSRDTINALSDMGVACRILTGDRPEAAAVHGLTNVEAGLTPLEKQTRVDDLRSSGHHVLFVGDGVNDAAAMAAADASIAIATGAPIAREAASAELPGAELTAVPFAIARCRAAVATLRGNLLFAASYNLIGITLAAAGFLHPVAAALLMLVSSFTVTGRALREAAPPRPAQPPVRRAPAATSPLWILVVAAAIAIQGPVIAILGGFQGSTAIGFVVLFLGAAIALGFLLTKRRFTPETAMAASMFSVGGLVMLAGWWADAGFGPIVRDGVCLCNCATSTMGLGLFARMSWMDVGMVVASLPALALPGSAGFARVGCWIAGMVGMILGMEVAVWLMAMLPPTHPQATFFATYAAMASGMMIGMTSACGMWRKVIRRP